MLASVPDDPIFGVQQRSSNGRTKRFRDFRAEPWVRSWRTASSCQPGATSAAGSGVVGQQPTSGLPAWLTSDWLVVIVASIGVFFSVIAAGAVLGAINALVFTSSASAAINGAITGLYLGFSSFAVEITALSSESEFQALVATKYLPIVWFLGFVAVVWYAFRFCEQRMDGSIENRRAVILKMALVFGLVASISGALLSFNKDTIDSGSFSTDGLSAKVNSGTAFLYGFLLVGLIGISSTVEHNNRSSRFFKRRSRTSSSRTSPQISLKVRRCILWRLEVWECWAWREPFT